MALRHDGLVTADSAIPDMPVSAGGTGDQAAYEQYRLPVVCLIGPTASGKTARAVEFSRRLRDQGCPAEIVNADSMSVYRGMDIGTAKPSSAEQSAVVHHLIDILDITQNASVAEFQQLARAAIFDCRRRGVLPIVVGGSALYIHAIVDEFQFPGTDPGVRARLESELADAGPAALHRRLATVDPQAAAEILPGNGRRIVRALEVVELTGRSFVARLPEPRYALAHVVQVGIATSRTDRDQRIADRVQRMWDQGLVDEVRRLIPQGLRDGRTASRALGYRQILQYLDGEFDEAEAKRQTITKTRKFARRQDSWFRRDDRIAWITTDDADPLGAIDRIVEQTCG